MKDTKLVAVLKSFSPAEFRKFGQFVNSPYFNRLKNILKFYEVLKGYYPEFSGRNLTEENIFSQLFPGVKFDYWKMKLLISDMMKLAEEFMISLRIKKNEFDGKKYLLEELSERKLDKLFEIRSKEVSKFINSKKIKGEEYYFKKYETELIIGTYKFLRKDFSTENYLLNISDPFINYLLLRILKLYTYMINEEIAYKTGDTKLSLINELVNHIKQYSYRDIAGVRIYFLILMLTMNDNDENYFELKEIKKKNSGNLDDEELYNINTSMGNYCTRMVLKGKDVFLSEYFELIEESLREISDNQNMSLSHFRFMNAVITGIKLDKTEWVENFISVYQHVLQKEYRDDTVNLTTAMLYFAKNDFEIALTELMKINFDDCHHKMHFRNLTLQIYYELNYFEPALSVVDSYKHFLSREKSISDLYKDYNSNFVKYLNEMLKIKMGVGNLKADELLFEINKSDEFANKSWVKAKLEEIMA